MSAAVMSAEGVLSEYQVRFSSWQGLILGRALSQSCRREVSFVGVY